MTIKLVIFDCDGVLVDSEFIAARLECARYGEQGLEMSVQEFSARFSGMTGEAIFKEAQEILGRRLPGDLCARIEAELDRLLDTEVDAVAGAGEVIDRIALPSCICSNSSADRLKRMLLNAGLHDRFHPNIFSARDLDPPAPKPKPDIYRAAIQHFRIDPREALVIEDSVHGVTAAIGAGARVAGFTGGKHTHPSHSEQLSEAGAETVYARHRDLPHLIKAFDDWDGMPA